MEWISLVNSKPKFGQICDIWVEAHDGIAAHRRSDYVFTVSIGVDQRNAFQEYAAYDSGLYEDAFFLEENLITHYMIIEPPKQ